MEFPDIITDDEEYADSAESLEEEELPPSISSSSGRTKEEIKVGMKNNIIFSRSTRRNTLQAATCTKTYTNNRGKLL